MSLPNYQFAHLQVPLEDILSATKNFDEENTIRKSGFAKEYKGESVIDDQDNKYLALVATFHYKKKILDEMVDPVLWKQMDLQSFNVFAEIAYQRPNIHEVVTRLESALKLQMERQNAEHSVVVAEVEIHHPIMTR
nr:receptor-like tyrosine-protein kinase kin-15 [Tanacetum cinerariifolium]